jgi:hypothetical protein
MNHTIAGDPVLHSLDDLGLVVDHNIVAAVLGFFTVGVIAMLSATVGMVRTTQTKQLTELEGLNQVSQGQGFVVDRRPSINVAG